MQDKVDIALGYAATGIGTTGAAFQLWGQVGSALVIGLNVVLALLGIYLLRLRIKSAHLDRDRAERLEREASNRGDTPPGE